MNQTAEFRQDQGSDSVARRLIWAMLAQAVVVLLAGLNLTVRLSAHPVGAFEFVRWRETISLLVFVPASVGIMFHVIWMLEQGRRDAKWPVTLAGIGACLLGISMGIHEPMNTLPALDARLVATREFWDEVFSHGLFYLAFVGITSSVLWSQVRNPLPMAMRRRTTAVFAGMAIIMGTGIFLSLLSGGDIRADLAVMGLVLLAAEWMRKGKSMRYLPIVMVIEVAGLLALLGLLVQRWISGCC